MQHTSIVYVEADLGTSNANPIQTKMENLIKLERPGTLQYQAYERIKTLLINGQLEFDRVYSANHFAEILGVSRTPIREALLQLTAEGFFTSLRGRGFKIKKFSAKEIQDFFEARKMIEAYVIEQLVDEVREEDLKPLDDSLEQMIDGYKKSGSYNFLEADKSFHMNLIHRYENSLLESILGNIRDSISLLGQKALASPGRVQEVIEEHRDILEALHQRDKGQAVRTLKHHLDTTEKSILENL
jgi:DNA-binding GntR family transcriptional regulator